MQNVISVRGGKIHLMMPDHPTAFPLCSSGARNTYTHYRSTDAEITCKECAGILSRRTARLAREAAECGADPCCGQRSTDTGCIFTGAAK